MASIDLRLAHMPAPPPIDALLLVSDGTSLVALDFGAPEDRLIRLLKLRYGADATLSEAEDPQGFAGVLRDYFAGSIDALDAIPVDGGGTAFQRRVWAALRTIPPGRTRSYSQIAADLGQPGAARAVGLANGQNPVNLVVPCHRVIGTAGALTGYGGGLDRKRWLLDHERRHTADAGLGLPLFETSTLAPEPSGSDRGNRSITTSPFP